jgi:hypothetical protein
MAQAITLQKQNNELLMPNLICGAAILGCAGAVTSLFFSSVNPIAGAAFGASYSLSSQLVQWVCTSVNCCPDSLVARVATFVMSSLVGIGVAMAVAAGFGASMTFGTAAIFTIVSVATAISAFLACGGCLCCSALATGIATANNGNAPATRS